MSHAQKRGDRSKRAVLAVLKAHSGEPLTVKELAKQAAKLGPDAPTIKPTVFHMVQRGELIVVGHRHQGTRLLDMPVTLPPQPQ